MAFKQIIVVCPFEGDDKGKRFHITRMSAVAADRWGRHCIQAAAAAGQDLPGINPEGGLAAVATVGIGLFSLMDPERMDDLLDQLTSCIALQPDAANPNTLLPWPIAQTQIEEISTVAWLQAEAFKLHVDFFKGVGLLSSLLNLLLQNNMSAPTPNTPTSTSGSPLS